jgi:putative endonuclease
VNRYRKGQCGEEKAAYFLKDLGYEIIERNYRGPRGEIDLIAQDGCEIVFFEVKNWDAYPQHALERVIGKQKQSRICRTAKRFIMDNPQHGERTVRFDVVLLTEGMTKITHIENAFGGVYG